MSAHEADIHSCSYYCNRPGCIKAQRDELREQAAQTLQALTALSAKRRIAGEWGPYADVVLWADVRMAFDPALAASTTAKGTRT